MENWSACRPTSPNNDIHSYSAVCHIATNSFAVWVNSLHLTLLWRLYLSSKQHCIVTVCVWHIPISLNNKQTSNLRPSNHFKFRHSNIIMYWIKNNLEMVKSSWRDSRCSSGNEVHVFTSSYSQTLETPRASCVLQYV